MGNYRIKEMVVAIPSFQTKYIAHIKRMRGKIEAHSTFEVI